MKWNWGTGIFLFIVGFVVACVVFVIWTRSFDWSLVEEDYYPKELRHEEKLEKMRNAASLGSPVLTEVTPSGVTVVFPAALRGAVLTGAIHIYRPSDERMDRTIPLVADTAMRRFLPSSLFVSGRYVLKIEWSGNDCSFYAEKEIDLP